ncbi:helix-turn-helix transcriptional regulator [Waterburya agarophytonicola K14]|uniref:Helix-turn-helix transcriptional regulator n=1 Tax=Waterburya agarophytonicola KI4 TaxID=2874699 RepID=A0A964BLG3_9CYAN|nr:helix-turn-helix transcriptional regulator [Waterburya agarophytonicola KI4]
MCSYRIVHLCDRKLLSDRWGDESSGGARRKYYCLTELGVKTLTDVQEYRQQLAKS